MCLDYRQQIGSCKPHVFAKRQDHGVVVANMRQGKRGRRAAAAAAATAEQTTRPPEGGVG